jgi:hypothetical protein
LSGTYGHHFCEYVKWEYAPAGLSDLVAYFVRRIYKPAAPGRLHCLHHHQLHQGRRHPQGRVGTGGLRARAARSTWLWTTLGERYHEHRRALMKCLWLGLTDIYNLFHTRDLTPAEVARVSKKPLPEAEAGYQGILELRRLHRELDLAIRDAYGWTDLDLGHDFHEVETLPENDRVRYTISPAARKEVLKRLLAENHKRAAASSRGRCHSETNRPTRGRKAKAVDETNGDLFA